MPNVSETSVDRRALGAQAEAFVSKYLQNNGFQIIAHNYRCRGGEIDIIASKEDVLVFVEVKFRTTHYFPLSQIVSPSKQRKIIQTAQWYIMHHAVGDKVIRFDIALVESDNLAVPLTYIPNAFTQGDNAW
jgi:putative endonuclease